MRIILGSLVTALLLMIQSTNAKLINGFAVRSCCPYNQIMKDGVCSEMTEAELTGLDPFLNVTLQNGLVVKWHYENDKTVLWDSPMSCETTDMIYLDNRNEKDQFTLFENGTIMSPFDEATLSKWAYCLQPHLLEDDSIRVVPHICSARPKKAQTVVMIISMACLLLTIIAYLLVKKLRNLHGKCFICYMACLFMGYLFLLLDLWSLSQDFCMTSGFLGYFFVMAAFFWLSAISLQLQNDLFGTSSKDRFVTFSFYAWGMAVTLTGVTLLANKLVKNNDFNPRIGNEGHCWISSQYWSAIIYFYGPMYLLVMFNLIMFILTVKRIIDVRWNLEHEQKRKQEPIVENFFFFFRLFIIMGLSWIFEIISYLVQSNKFWSDIFVVADYFNWSQGIIIFVLFILRGSTLKLLKQSITGEGEESETGSSVMMRKDSKSYLRFA